MTKKEIPKVEMISVPMDQVTVLKNPLFLLATKNLFSMFSKNPDPSKVTFFKKKRTSMDELGVKINYEITSKEGLILFSINFLRTEKDSKQYIVPEEIAEHKMNMLSHFHLIFRKGVTADFVINRLNDGNNQLIKEIMYLLSETPLVFGSKEDFCEKDLKTFLEKTFKENIH